MVASDPIRRIVENYTTRDRARELINMDESEIKELLRADIEREMPDFSAAKKAYDDLRKTLKAKSSISEDEKRMYDMVRGEYEAQQNVVDALAGAVYAKIAKTVEVHRPLAELEKSVDEVRKTPVSSNYRPQIEYLIKRGDRKIENTVAFKKLRDALAHSRLNKELEEYEDRSRDGLHGAYDAARADKNKLTALKEKVDIEREIAAEDLLAVIKGVHGARSSGGIVDALLGVGTARRRGTGLRAAVSDWWQEYNEASDDYSRRLLEKRQEKADGRVLEAERITAKKKREARSLAAYSAGALKYCIDKVMPKMEEAAAESAREKVKQTEDVLKAVYDLTLDEAGEKNVAKLIEAEEMLGMAIAELKKPGTGYDDKSENAFRSLVDACEYHAIVARQGHKKDRLRATNESIRAMAKANRFAKKTAKAADWLDEEGDGAVIAASEPGADGCDEDDSESAAGAEDIEDLLAGYAVAVDRREVWKPYIDKIVKYFEEPEEVESIGGVLRKIVKWGVIKPLKLANFVYKHTNKAAREQRHRYSFGADEETSGSANGSSGTNAAPA